MKREKFSKYEDWGAYHWEECDRSSRKYNPPLEARYQAVVKRIIPGSRVLDVGCGDGYLINLLSPMARQVVGIELEPAGIRLASIKLQNVPNVYFLRGSCYCLPFPNRYFDCVLLTDVIEHLYQPESCLKEICRVLSCNGILFLTTPKGVAGKKPGWGHVKEFTPEELNQILLKWFTSVNLIFLWPNVWMNKYRTRIGWHLIKIFARNFYNPFGKEGSDPRFFDQILAVCKQPLRDKII